MSTVRYYIAETKHFCSYFFLFRKSRFCFAYFRSIMSDIPNVFWPDNRSIMLLLSTDIAQSAKSDKQFSIRHSRYCVSNNECVYFKRLNCQCVRACMKSFFIRCTPLFPCLCYPEIVTSTSLPVNPEMFTCSCDVCERARNPTHSRNMQCRSREQSAFMNKSPRRTRLSTAELSDPRGGYARRDVAQRNMVNQASR